jgi:hypothetical protein
VANEATDVFGDILTSTIGIIFMGTPHRGIELTSWATLLSNVVNAVSLGQAVRKDILRNLEANSAVLMEISRQFVHRSTSLQIMSFFELQLERPLTTVVSDHYYLAAKGSS